MPIVVKNIYLESNQQVTKKKENLVYFSNLVETSETTRATNTTFSQWLAGLIDGDGSLLLSKSGYASCEITMDLRDEKALIYIQNKIGGSIKLRSGAKALRWRLHNKPGMIQLIHLINGNIRNNARLIQLHKLCSHFDITCLVSQPLHNKHSWFAGYFDADGTITFSLKNTPATPQMTISVTSKHMIDIKPFKDIFGGNIHFDKSQNGYYKWSVQSKTDILMMLEYFKLCSSRSLKSNRIHLIPLFFELKSLKAYREDETLQHKAWLKFLDKWSHWEI